MREFMQLPDNLPVPTDDGACDHLTGLEMPAVTLGSTRGRRVELKAETARKPTVIFFYPRTGVPGEPEPVGWDDIPGARGCTPQSCGFRDLAGEFGRLGYQVFGASSQDSDFHREFAARNHIPFEILSDERFELTEALRLPTFTYGGMRLIKRLALVIRDGRIMKVFYPVFPPNRNAETVLAWVRASS